MDFWLFLFSKDTEFAHALGTVIGSSSVVHGLSNQNCLSPASSKQLLQKADFYVV